MLNAILVEMDSKTHVKNMLAEAERRRLVQSVRSASKSGRPERRLPETSALRRLVASLGYTAP
jgi:hypothetical protein